MPKYIELEKALQRFEEIKKTTTLLKESFYLDGVMAVLETIPAADAAPVVHGKWEFEPESEYLYASLACSECGWRIIEDSNVKEEYLYCPNCGAKLDSEE